MAGMVLGRYFKLVVTPLLHAGRGCGEPDAGELESLEARIEALDDELEYPWDEFATTVAQAADRVSERELIAIGERIVRASKSAFERWGFDSAEAMLTDLDAPFGAMILDPPEHERLTTAKYEPGYAVFRVGVTHPGALLQGYLRGIVEIHGSTVHALACHLVHMDGQAYHLLELRWSTPASTPVVARTRIGSGPRMVA
jgi:hypothetical protein